MLYFFDMVVSDNNKILTPVSKEFIGEKEWFFLYWIAYYKFKNRNSISTPQLCNLVPISQQTVSRRIIELEEQGYLKRYFRSQGSELDLTPKGYLELRSVLKDLQMLFVEESCGQEFFGNLQSGMKEGAYYIQNEKYLAQFHDKLGFIPYFGTLNLHISQTIYDLLYTQKIPSLTSITIEGFSDGLRQYGDVVCYEVLLWSDREPNKKAKGALLQIQRTSHKQHVLEFIAEKYLRDYFNLSDNDIVYFQFISR